MHWKHLNVVQPFQLDIKHYVCAFFKLLLKQKIIFYQGIVSPSDIDMFLHMNNSRYGRAADFARTSYFVETGLARFLRDNNSFFVMSASAIRYRKSLGLFQKYMITTKVKCVWLVTVNGITTDLKTKGMFVLK